MNERIKELAEQAMWHTNSKTGEVYRTHFQFEERFAELIVRECALVVHNKTGPKSALDVLNHFGIEE